jgi:hypothetical protein
LWFLGLSLLRPARFAISSQLPICTVLMMHRADDDDVIYFQYDSLTPLRFSAPDDDDVIYFQYDSSAPVFF